MVIPKKFTINGQTIKVNIVDTIDGPLYGQYKSVLKTIEIARYVKTSYGLIKPSEYEMINTFIHEAIHAYQDHYIGEFDEQEACTLSGFLTELFQSCGIDMELNNRADDVPTELPNGYEKAYRVVQETQEETFDTEVTKDFLS